jgi:hypothetical protein
MMFGRSRLLIAGVAALAAVAALTAAEEFGHGPAPQEGVVLLRNGEAIEGKISRVGELYYVAVARGEIRVKAAEVEFCCPSLEEGYREKRAAIQSGDVHAHLRLAEWCLRHNLLGPAGRELSAALEADPHHPMIGLLERRLQMAVEPPPQRLPSKPITQAPSFEELDRLVRSMPPGSVETFTQTIQPLLLNHCGAAGCHGPQSHSEFRLLRIPLGRPPTRRLTQRNLQAVLAWVDREDPAASRLLTVPIRPHGTARKAIFSGGQAGQYKRMVDWVCLLSKRPGAGVPLPSQGHVDALPNGRVASTEKPPVHAMPAEPPASQSSPPKARGASDRQPATGSDSGSQEPAVQGPSVQRGAPLPIFVPVDPFDPEIFNRRFFGDSPRKPQAEGANGL